MEELWYNEYFGDCVEWFVNEMLEVKQYVESKYELKLHTVDHDYDNDKFSCWLCEEVFETDGEEGEKIQFCKIIVI